METWSDCNLKNLGGFQYLEIIEYVLYEQENDIVSVEYIDVGRDLA